jgi:hypothetical protein
MYALNAISMVAKLAVLPMCAQLATLHLPYLILKHAFALREHNQIIMVVLVVV